MKTRLTSVTYLGYTAMDRRFSNAMLPWLLREIRTTGIGDKLSIAIEDGCLKAYNGNFEPVIVHRLVDILRASQVPGRPEELFYILLNEKEGLLNCYLYKAATVHEVTDLFGQMREPSPGGSNPKGSAGALPNGSVTKNIGFQQQHTSELPWSSPAISLPGNCNNNLTSEPPQSGLVRSVSNASTLTSLCADLSPSDSHFFEVLYIGKVRISQRKVPDSLIDDALNKFALHEAEKIKNQRRHSLYPSSTETCNYNNASTENLADNEKEKCNLSTTPLAPDKIIKWDSIDTVDKQSTVENNEIDKEFDMFTKERVEINSQMRKSQTLESMSSNIHKNNLGTVTEDEEKHDIQSIITETASSITKFCENTIKDANKIDVNSIVKDPSPGNNKQSTEIETKEENIQQSKDKLSQQDRNESKEIISENEQSLKSSIEKFNTLSSTKLFNKEIKRCMVENKPFLRDRSASIGTLNLKTPIAHLIGEQNRTMLFQVGRSELRLISPDRKQILLHRAFKDVASCVLGRINRDHFGFVCRENNDSYACYVFKCESDSVATEVVNAIKQAFFAHAELLKKSREKSPNMTCEHCPMLWYHRLCHDIEGMNEKKTHAFILRRIEQLSEDEQDLIITKYQGGTNHMYEVSEHNAFLMMLLRAHCEAKQSRHIHDTAENRSEFLNQYLGGSTIFMKAKRSLSSSFDHLLKRKASKDEASLAIPQVAKKEASPLSHAVVDTPSEPSTPEIHLPEGSRSKSQSPSVRTQNSDSPPSPRQVNASGLEEEGEEKEEPGTPVNSPMMDIFMKVSDSRPVTAEVGSDTDATWRQAIYEKVVQPPELQKEGEISSQKLLGIPTAPQGKRTKDQLRQLWKLAIDQTILLVRMEKENARLKESEESSAVRRIKLEYTELGVCDAGVLLIWDSLLSTKDSSRQMAKVDRHMLTQAVIQGVPRTSRGGVWYFLAEQATLSAPPLPAHYHAPYRTLLAGLTKHQHAILIDLGRTFPKHSYFASALGPGQLALYNILKAYSLLDPEVGYCQGLSFVAGVLLLHTEEAEAFGLLRHLMFRRGLRRQYLPDMSALQVQLYQLSRLLRDHEPELHAKLESLDISPALYAAPWMLTLFTSQFPLGFVVRVFDLIFLESFDVVFSVSLALLSAHRDGLMLCESCEEAAEYLKHKMPDIDKGVYEKIMRKVHSLDIGRQLNDYAVEYAVLREEMPRLATLTEENKHLLADNSRMSEELDSAMDAIMNYQKVHAKLETQNKNMEQQLTLLSRYMSAYHRQEMPPEIKKIVQTHSKKISFSSKITSFSSKFTSNDEEEERRIFKTGVSTPNLFSKITREDVVNAANIEKKPQETERKFIMKKSQSVHSGLISNNLKNYPLKVLDEKFELSPKKSDSFRTELTSESLQDAGRKNSGFFANTHEQIRQERMFEQQLKHDFDENLKKFDERSTCKSYMDDLNMFQSRKTMSLNLNTVSKAQDIKLNDSGFVTPLSPNESERRDECVSNVSHPLSDCDVDIKFDGQSTKLKQIRPIKQPSSIK
ncbi:TBC1 domain family member 4 [Achroia grisella]|uniref:TBC1 domain family member 4 n=1 Tax=Achroia grisella TaxID=688607 RepID=UPI0027D2C198|nr:TBC1 domain family member 4 [Achroia grisella]